MPKNENKIIESIYSPERRDFLENSLACALTAFAAPPFLLRAFTADSEKKVVEGPKKKLKMKSGAKRKITVVDPLFAGLVGEHLKFEVDFLSTFKAADLDVTFRPGYGNKLIAEIDAVATGVVGWATKMKRQFFRSYLEVMEINGKKRLVATYFSRVSVKGKRVYKSIHRFDYKRGEWHFRKYRNGKRKKREVRKILPGVFYEDFVGFMYNVRAGCYGEMKPGHEFSIQTVPYKEIDSYKIHVASKEQMDEEKKWVKKTPGAALMGIVEIHQKIFGMKTGEGKVLVDKNLIPLSGKVKDAVSFGDVTVNLVKRSKV